MTALLEKSYLVKVFTSSRGEEGHQNSQKSVHVVYGWPLILGVCTLHLCPMLCLIHHCFIIVEWETTEIYSRQHSNRSTQTQINCICNCNIGSISRELWWNGNLISNFFTKLKHIIFYLDLSSTFLIMSFVEFSLAQLYHSTCIPFREIQGYEEVTGSANFFNT